ncbi:hypothetical protein LTR53_009296, partial [Teratosphaeriaceae sp. CCFEE 6253]
MQGDGRLPEIDATGVTHTTVNNEYAAYSARDGVHFFPLDRPDERRRLALDGGLSRTTPVIALSPLLSRRIAVSSGEQVHVFDLRTGERCLTLHGLGRAVTAIAWSLRNPDVLAIGTLSGIVSVWDIKRQAVPLLELRKSSVACSCLAFSSLDESLIAIAYASSITVWSVDHPHRPLRRISHAQAPVSALTWHRSIRGRLLSVTIDGTVHVWETATSRVAETGLGAGSSSESDDEGVFGRIDGLTEHASPIAQLQLQDPATTAEWLGEHGIYVTLPSRNEVRVYSFGADWEMLHEVWRAMVKFAPQATMVHGRDGSTSMTTVAPDLAQSYAIPSTILDAVGGHSQTPPAQVLTSNAPSSRMRLGQTSPGRDVMPATTVAAARPSSMRPVPITQLRDRGGSFARTSKQLQHRRRGSSGLSRQTAFTSHDDVKASPSTPASKAMTSSLEIPKIRDLDEESPMPFLSPSIPARRPSPNTAPRIEESNDLPSLRSTSFDSLPSTTNQDSDSDDETFAGGMRGSSAFMPGAVNVPLPKACGALFAPNGHLLTFFPPKPRPSSAAKDHTESHGQATPLGDDGEIARLFPTFGNLTASEEFRADNAADGANDHERAADVLFNRPEFPSFGFQPASFNSLSAWNVQQSPTKSTFDTTQAHKIVVSVHDLADLTPQRALAESYRHICRDDETGSDLCRHNAGVAEDAGLNDAASIWRLLALLLEDKVPLRLVHGGGDQTDILVVARRATRPLQNDSAMDLAGPQGHAAAR